MRRMRALDSSQRTLLEEVVAARRPDLLWALPEIEGLPLEVRNEVREVVGEELAERELVAGGESVTSRGEALETLIDRLGPRASDP